MKYANIYLNAHHFCAYVNLTFFTKLTTCLCVCVCVCEIEYSDAHTDFPNPTDKLLASEFTRAFIRKERSEREKGRERSGSRKVPS